jgi:hypothetical protein
LVAGISYFTLIVVCLVAIQVSLLNSGLMEYWSLRNNFIFGIQMSLFYVYNICCALLLSIIYSLTKGWNSILNEHVKQNFFNSLKFMRLSGIFHIKICEIADLFSNIFFLNMLTFFMQSFYMCLMSSFNILNLIISPNSTRVYFAVLTSSWFIQFFPYVIWMTLFSNLLIEEGKRMMDLMNRIHLNDRKMKGKHQRMIVFHQQSFHNIPIVYCWFFPLDWTLFFSMMCGILNYFIILIQMYDVNE